MIDFMVSGESLGGLHPGLLGDRVVEDHKATCWRGSVGCCW